jgi:predicted metal-dependent phosphoesterase TrpH
MKFKVQMKDPDTLHDSIREAVEAQIKEIGITDRDEIEAIADARVRKVQELCSTWFSYGEYLTVEIDTEAKTCTVLPARD